MADVSEFISGLPSYNEKNFSSFFNEPSVRYSGKLSAYLATEDRPPQQVIIPERSNVLLRYLHQQWLKKNVVKKRDLNTDAPESSGSSKKRPRPC